MYVIFYIHVSLLCPFEQCLTLGCHHCVNTHKEQDELSPGLRALLEGSPVL